MYIYCEIIEKDGGKLLKIIERKTGIPIISAT